jgi:signal transduction histidine kinase
MATVANLEPVDLNELVNTLVSDRRHLVQDKGLTLDFVPASQLPSVLADSKLLFQVLTNLLSNAINYTLPGGAVAIQTAISEEDGRQWVTVTVRDTGLGMSSDDQTHLFERFFRGEAADITHASGAGLGLAICREIIDRHGGRITVRSEIGRGSSFTLWLQPAVPI